MGKLIPKELLPINEDGLRQCRMCTNSVKPPRRTLCSENCAHQLKLRISGRYLRYCVYQRDNAICSICKMDTKLIAKQALSLDKIDRDKYLKNLSISLKRKIWKRKYGGGLWDADHIIPVKEGGGQCGLDNIRTLCIKCHKEETKKLKQKNNK